MKRASLGLVLLVGCATVAPPPPPFAPTDVVSLVGPAPKPADLSAFPDGPDSPVSAGQCKGLPPGIWVSERRFAERLVAVVARDRCLTELGAYKRLHEDERRVFAELEAALQRRALDADLRADRRLWLGIAIGAGIAALSSWAVRR